MGVTEPTASASASASPATPVEVELKLEVLDPRAAQRWLETPIGDGLVAIAPAATRSLVDRYVDTAEGHLRRAGRVARLRTDGEAVTATVKSLARSDGGLVHRREELEAPATADLEPRSWPASDVRSLILELVGDAALVEIVSIGQRRRARRYDAGTTQVEVSIDRVRTLRDGKVLDRFVELEAELLDGDEAVLTRLGERLAVDPALAPARTSKLERALAAVERADRDATRLRIPVGKQPGVQATDLLAEAARKVLAFHFDRLLAREAGTREGSDPEQLHQMRVATRRLRAAWRTFDGAFDDGTAKKLQKPLRAIARRLGAVRDIDVLLLDAIEHRSTLDEPAAIAFEPFIDGLHARREAARVELMLALDKPSYRRWLEDSVAFLSTPGAGATSATAGTPSHVRELAPARVWTAYGHVLAYDTVVAWADVPSLHQIRIEGKRLRYALEFFREALGPGVEELIARVTRLQDHLGELHDADVAAATAREFLVHRATDLGPEQRRAIGTYVRARDARLRRLRGSVGRPWRAIIGLTFRRRLGAVLAGL